ncbi:MAG: phenylalanine--tRNA ligase subunit beta, partial [Bacteroidota bacterium]
MKASLNWLKEYMTINLSPEEISEILTDIGLEVEGMEEIESIKGGLKGVVVGHITTCTRHPNADKLSLTKVNVGAEEDLQIVCGAPNVAAGQKVLVATVGTTLYDKEGNPFKIKKGKIRGEVSQGMICAEDELGLGDSHDGIIVLPENAAVGCNASDYYEIENDIVYEIGLTPNRSDATCHTGIAKDLAAALKINFDGDGQVKMPAVDNFQAGSGSPIEVVVEDYEACPRYSGVVIKNVEIKESPDWLKNRLSAIGVRPISNIVDITNFVLHELGQPLHAFDADKIAGKKIIVKKLPEDSPFLSLDEVERKLSSEDLMICDGESKGMCIAGVFGGLDSGVTDSTETIFLESAHFHAKMTRRTSTRHLLFTDAAKVFEKGSDPNMTVFALKRAALLMQELAGGEIASEIVDIYPNKISKREIDITFRNIHRLIGINISPEEIRNILASMKIDVLSETEEGMRVAIPTNKADVLREVDVIEEILRIYGFNKVPISNQIKSAITIREGVDKVKIRNTISSLLTGNGFHEMMAMSLTQNKYFEDILPMDKNELVYVNNTSNIHLDVMRPTMLVGGLETILHNQNRQNTNVKVFEFGRTYKKLTEGEFPYQETEHLSVLMTGDRYEESWLNADKSKVSYFSLKTYVNNVLERLGIQRFQTTAIKDDIFTYGLKYHRGASDLVSFGKIQSKLLKKMDIKQEVFYADFNWNAITKALRKHKISYQEITKFPSIRRDLALV